MPAGTDTLWPGERLLSGQRLSSPNDRCHFEMQTDGNLVLYVLNESNEWKPKFSSETSGPNIYCLMQRDGNLVLYRHIMLDPNEPDPPDMAGVWASDTGGNPGAYLKVFDDGDVCIMGVIWHRGMTPW